MCRRAFALQRKRLKDVCQWQDACKCTVEGGNQLGGRAALGHAPSRIASAGLLLLQDESFQSTTWKEQPDDSNTEQCVI